ncbi:alpha/beta hydrolase [Nonlabens ponticola]|uniref:Alpha/beta hydrolase n=1 Tax=Nonlabens ponticola TaxID=2496866 RepID=A0A3S9N182_9FLAO|nr:alpha/beta hydrolase [Nonlabens ponticola]
MVYDEITGVDDNLLSFDVYYPNTDDAALRPVVFYVHGGGWRIGDKANSLENKIALGQREDYILVSTNYRLSPSIAANDPDRIKYPIHNKDIATAFRWVYDNIAQYKGNREQIALLGHSAGAQMVSLMGTNEQFLNEVGLGLGDLSGVASIDTEGYDVLSQVEDGNEIYINAFGTDEQQNRAASPLLNINDVADYPPFFIAKRGSSRRIAQADDFINSLEQVGTTVEQITANQYTHQEINVAIGMIGETAVTEPLAEFLERCFTR